MARKFRVAVKNVVLSQIDPADYPAVAGLIDGMHPTWRDWHRERSAFEMSARRQGHKIVYVPVEAAEFGAWAEAKGRKTLTADDLSAYVNQVAGRK